MKKIHVLVALLLSAAIASAQLDKCATMHVLKESIKQHNLTSTFYTAEQAANKWLEENKAKITAKTKAVIKIPVVVHVVYKNAAQNVPDSNIYSQISVLNECFRKMNSNYGNTRNIFDSIGADVELEFCLADKDPLGNATTGIIRKSTPTSSQFDPLFGFDNVKKPSKGGDTLWPPSRYLNIWTCDMSLFSVEAVLGYAQFPGMAQQTDGVVIQYNYFGRYAKPKFLGRTTVHEVGHWLGMRHIWADDAPGLSQPGTCDSTDFVYDTPNCKSQSAQDCDTVINSCSNEDPYWGTIDPPDMVENYMDYSKDSCMTMFTKGQKARMYSFLNTNPDRLAICTSTAGCATFAGVGEIKDLGNYVNVYPNPASDLVKITLNNLGYSDFNYEMFNATGQRVKTGKINYLITEVNTADLSAGIYFLKVYNTSNTITKRVVVNR